MTARWLWLWVKFTKVWNFVLRRGPINPLPEGALSQETMAYILRREQKKGQL